jgi:probable phosphoglycerate mutase
MSTLEGTKARRRIYLMRHGHVDYLARHVVASGDIHSVPLTARGRSQAEAAGKALAHVSFDRAVCSGLPRTRETAEIVLRFQASAPKLEVIPDLVEIQGGKPQPVKSRDELIERMSRAFAEAAAPGAPNSDGGETYANAQSRAVKTIVNLLAEPGWKQMLIAAHEGINRLVLSWAAGAGLHAMGSFEQDTGCVNVLDFDLKDGVIDRPIIKAVNLTPYNYLKHGMNLTSLESIFERDVADVLV